MKLQALIVFVCLMIVAPAVLAEPLPRERVPEPLRPWTDWVLRGHEDQLCPMVQTPANEHRCLWPSRLTLTVGETASPFSQDFRVYRATSLLVPRDPLRSSLSVGPY